MSGSATPLRALIVEDNELSRSVLCEQLRMLHVAVDESGTGEDALAAAERTGYDLVLMDLGLPDGSGLIFARLIRRRLAARGLQPRFVAVTGHADAEMRARAFEAGFDEYIIKPLRRAHIEQLLRTLPPGAAASVESAASAGARGTLEATFDDPGELRDILRLAVESIDGFCARLRAAHRQHNREAAVFAAHQALTVALDIGNDDIAAAARSIEIEANRGAWQDAGSQIERLCDAAGRFAAENGGRE
jgi:CheY-like chemotaxis protein